MAMQVFHLFRRSCRETVEQRLVLSAIFITSGYHSVVPRARCWADMCWLTAARRSQLQDYPKGENYD